MKAAKRIGIWMDHSTAHLMEYTVEDFKVVTIKSELEGLDIRFNKFGQLISSVSLDELNGFLNKNVRDRKLEEKFDKEAKEKPKRKINK